MSIVEENLIFFSYKRLLFLIRKDYCDANEFFLIKIYMFILVSNVGIDHEIVC